MAVIDIKHYIISNISTKVEIEIIQYALNSSDIARVNFNYSEGKSISYVMVWIEGDDFNKWTTDGSMVDIILTKLGLIRAPVV